MCFECHEQTQRKGGFARGLDRAQILLYRDSWLQTVAAARSTAHPGDELHRTTENLYDAQLVTSLVEINRGRELGQPRVPLRRDQQRRTTRRGSRESRSDHAVLEKAAARDDLWWQVRALQELGWQSELDKLVLAHEEAIATREDLDDEQRAMLRVIAARASGDDSAAREAIKKSERISAQETWEF